MSKVGNNDNNRDSSFTNFFSQVKIKNIPIFGRLFKYLRSSYCKEKIPKVEFPSQQPSDKQDLLKNKIEHLNVQPFKENESKNHVNNQLDLKKLDDLYKIIYNDNKDIQQIIGIVEINNFFQEKAGIILHEVPKSSPSSVPISENPLLDNKLNARTIAMHNRLKDTNFNGDFLEIAGSKLFKVVDSNIDNFVDKPLVSVGSSKDREMVLFDPTQSPLLQQAYEKFVEAMQEVPSPSDANSFSKEIIKFMRKDVFSEKNDVQQRVDQFVASSDSTGIRCDGSPCIPIDKFIEKKIGVCRHHSLVAAYFLDRYMQENPGKLSFKGKIQIMRDNVINGAHAWLTLVTDKGEIHSIDTLNNFHFKIDEEAGQQKLIKIWGEEPVLNQLQKAEQLKKKIRP
jgi:hypothetical protein